MKISTLIFSVTFMSLCNLFAQSVSYKATDFTKADSVAALYPDHSLTDLRLLSGKLTTSLSTEEEKFRAIYKWVCDNISNDYSFYVVNKSKREKLGEAELKEWNRNFAPRVLKTLVDKHRTVCTGYALLVRDLASYAGISCEVINGYGRNAQANIGGTGIVNHSWNAVKLHDYWYLCDPTWSSGALDMKHRTFVKKYNDVYFLTSADLFVRNHYPLDSAWMLLRDKPTLQWYLNAPLVYSTALEYNVRPLTPETFNVTVVKGTKVSFQFSSDKEINTDAIALYVEQTPTHDVVRSKSQEEKSRCYMIDHLFSKRGAYAVHIVVNDHHAFTYKINVE